MLVYKYRGAGEKAFKRAIDGLKYNYFWASSPQDLNDPCEAITDKRTFKKQYRAISRFLGFRENWHMEHLDENADEVLSLADKMGILSLSKTYLNELLWAHYADGHRGFCIEYNLEYLDLTDGGNGVFSLPVTYSSKPPKISFLDVIRKGQNGIIHKNGFYKPLCWKYEEEHRVITNKIGENYYDPRAVKSIYFGLLISDEHKSLIRESLKGRDIKFYQIVQEKNSYEFNRQELMELEMKSKPQTLFTSSDGKTFSYEVVESKYHSHAGIGEFNIMLFERMNENQIVELSKEIKKNRFRTAKTLFFNFYLENRILKDSPSATCSFMDNVFVADCSNF